MLAYIFKFLFNTGMFCPELKATTKLLCLLSAVSCVCCLLQQKLGPFLALLPNLPQLWGERRSPGRHWGGMWGARGSP